MLGEPPPAAIPAVPARLRSEPRTARKRRPPPSLVRAARGRRAQEAAVPPCLARAERRGRRRPRSSRPDPAGPAQPSAPLTRGNLALRRAAVAAAVAFLPSLVLHHGGVHGAALPSGRSCQRRARPSLPRGRMGDETSLPLLPLLAPCPRTPSWPEQPLNPHRPSRGHGSLCTSLSCYSSIKGWKKS